MQNVLTVLTVNTKNRLRTLRQSVDRTAWVYPPAVVNAFYDPSLNDICNIDSQVITFPGVTHHGEGVSARMSRSSTLEPLTYITHFEIDQYPHIRRHMKKSTGVGYEPTIFRLPV